MKAIDIAELAKRSGTPASTLRYYEERGLIQSIGRRGLKRVFDAAVLNRLALITLGQGAGFSLDEIRAMFATDAPPRIDRQLLHSKADELDLSIRRMIALRNGLRHAAECPAPDHMECPTFQRLIKVARGRRGRTAPPKAGRIV
ncbi:MerR family transcriptional regulator [Sphingomonas sp. DBB INV C78]|uniref:helix-turn-helix domain-containing protein n=1 Tax=Sphingomonas sp. DBB INV C78 TaxID=3349434 RepID=UPI0036D27418